MEMKSFVLLRAYITYVQYLLPCVHVCLAYNKQLWSNIIIADYRDYSYIVASSPEGHSQFFNVTHNVTDHYNIENLGVACHWDEAVA